MIKVLVKNLEVGMRISRPVHKPSGGVILDAGTVINNDDMERLKIYGVEAVYTIRPETTEKPPVSGKLSAVKMKNIAPAQKYVRFKMESFKAHQENIDSVREIFKKLSVSENLDDSLAKDTSRLMVEHIIKNENVMIGLTNLKTFDNYLYAHSVNVAVLSLVIGKAMGLTNQQLETLGVSALLHDIGMLNVSRNILEKPGRLTQSESLEIQKHPTYGYNLILEKTKLGKDVAYSVYQHHERLDGSGYPNGLTGNFINLYAKIVGLADTYEAMSSPRVYREMYMSYSAMRHIIANATRLFDSNVLNAFISAVALYPVGSLVKLLSGEVAIVIKANKRFPVRPIIKILMDEKGEKVDGTVIVDLLKNSDIVIKEPVDPNKFDINVIKEF